jgi:hypothetical protein
MNRTIKAIIKYILMVVVLFSVSTVMTACGGDDNDENTESVKNTITAGTANYEVSSVNASYYENSGKYKVLFEILCKGLTYNPDADNISGTGAYLAFEIAITSSDGVKTLTPGTYTVVGYAGVWLPAYSRATTSSVLNGTVTISKNNDSYTLIYTGYYGETQLSLTYKGKVNIYKSKMA